MRELSKKIKKLFRRKLEKGRSREIAPDEIFIDSQNLPEFDVSQFEGRLVKPISKISLYLLGAFFAAVILVYAGQAWRLQISQGAAYEAKAEKNSLRDDIVFSKRGVILDRNGTVLAENVSGQSGEDFLRRKYVDVPGMSHIVGYVKYPQKDSSGKYYSDVISGVDGVEKVYNQKLSGTDGLRITETDALGNIVSESVIEPPSDGENLTLSVDSRVQSQLYSYLKQTAQNLGFKGAAAVMMDVHTGEILALDSYPEYSSQVLSDGSDSATIGNYVSDPSKPFLDRVVSGLYTPGSIVKPIMALGVLNEKIIDPGKQILSTGSISIPNPYDPKQQSIFLDWRPNGWVDLRRAIAVSSDVYFYEVGGGYQGQKGLGITNIEKYARELGLGEDTGIDLPGEVSGTIPDPAWKAEHFNGEPWYLGDTYHTVIGQYGFQVTPLQMARAVSAIANGGNLLTPSVLLGGAKMPLQVLDIPADYFKIVQEGMRETVTEGTAPGLKLVNVDVAAKTGTAQIGVEKQNINSWVEGYFPYENPRYAFAIVMEKGTDDGSSGAVHVIDQMLGWMSSSTPEYIK